MKRVAFALVLAFAGSARADDDPWLAPDKGKHFGVCAALAAGGYGVSSVWFERPWQRALLGGGLSLSVGAAKEGWDALGHGNPSGRDFAWDALGALTGVGVAYGIDLLVHRLRSQSDAAARGVVLVF